MAKIILAKLTMVKLTSNGWTNYEVKLILAQLNMRLN
jgi:hypothetical protein